MPYPPDVKALARYLDIECWRSYSGKPVEVKRALDVRRTAALRSAQETVDAVIAECVPQPKRNPMSKQDDFLSDMLAEISGAPGRSGWREAPKPAPMRYHSPVMKIEMMLHFATIAGPFTPESQRTSPAYTKFVKQLLADELIERPTHEEREEHEGWAYRATERGCAYVEGIKAVQLPLPLETTTTWGIPA